MKINCIDKEIQQVLETGYYQIPRFQRPYSWDRENISEFWNDSIIESEADYFIGSIVLYKSDDNKYGIVDGQQRLTTITMILCALRDFYISEGFMDFAQGVQNLIEKTGLNNKKQFILQTETSYPYFQEYIQKFGKPEIEVEILEEEENLQKGFEQIKTYIKELINQITDDDKIIHDKKKKEVERKLNQIRNQVLGLKIIYIELDNEDDAYIIFETLNTRGKDLSVSDLVKNYLTKLIKTRNANVDLPKDNWNKIRNIISGSSVEIDIDTFLLHVWMSKYEFTTLKTLFKKFKKEVKQGNAKLFLDDLIKDSESYRTIFEPSYKDWERNDMEIKECLDALQLFRVTQQTPMVLSVIREYSLGNLKPAQTLDILQAIEHFHYVFTAITSQRSSGGISFMYSSSARELFQAKNKTERLAALLTLKNKMRSKIPSLQEFLINFSALQFTHQFTKQKKIVQYTLKKIDKTLFKNTGLTTDYEKMTIEHITPQSHLSLFPSTGMIGNLILIDKGLNNRLSNKSFEQKIEVLRNSKANLDETLLSSKKWTDKEVVKRTDYLGKIAYKKAFKF